MQEKPSRKNDRWSLTGWSALIYIVVLSLYNDVNVAFIGIVGMFLVQVVTVAYYNAWLNEEMRGRRE